MKKLIVLFLFPIFTLSAQTEYDYQYENLYLPKDEKGNVVYSDIVDVPGLSGDQLYTSARIWFLEKFKSSKDVIQYEEREAGIVAGNGIMTVDDMALGYLIQTKISFSIRIETKDERFRYQISNLKVEGLDKSLEYRPIEYVFSKERLYKRNGNPRKRVFNFYWKYDDLIVNFEREIKNEMINPMNRIDKDW